MVTSLNADIRNYYGSKKMEKEMKIKYYGSKKMEKEMKIKDCRLMIESCKKKIFEYY